MPSGDEKAIQQLFSELMDAWNRGDASAFGARFQADGTFTNVNGGFYIGGDDFNLRHDEIFRGVFKGTTLSMTTRKLRFLRPDIAVVDMDLGVFGCHARPPGVQVRDGALRTCLLMVLTKDHGKWWIAAYHNVWRSGADYSK